MSRLSNSTDVEYPSGDGQPMAENTLQFEWIAMLKGGLDKRFRHDPNVFVAGDLFWYPVEGNNRLRLAPDAMVAFGRPKGHRSSYLQWQEDHIAPQVVFEVLSPGNRAGEMADKFAFYERFGVEEYYVINPDLGTFAGWLRQGAKLLPIVSPTSEPTTVNAGLLQRPIWSWESPRLGVRFEQSESGLLLLHPDGDRFMSYLELVELSETELPRAARAIRLASQSTAHADQESARAAHAEACAAQEAERADREAERADQEAERANREAERADQESERAAAAEREAAALAARLRELGFDPSA